MISIAAVLGVLLAAPAAGAPDKGGEYVVVVRIVGLAGIYAEPIKGKGAPDGQDVGTTWALFPEQSSTVSQLNFLRDHVERPDLFSYGAEAMSAHHLVVRVPRKYIPGSSEPGVLLLQPTASDPYDPRPDGRQAAEIGLSDGCGPTKLERFDLVLPIPSFGPSPSDAVLDRRFIDSKLDKLPELAARMKFGPGWTLAGCGKGGKAPECGEEGEAGEIVDVTLSQRVPDAKTPEAKGGFRPSAAEVTAHRNGSGLAVLTIAHASGAPILVPLKAINGRIEILIENVPADDALRGPMQHDHEDSLEHGKLIGTLFKRSDEKLPPPYFFWWVGQRGGRYCTHPGQFMAAK
jgi:hypothetical protein